MKTGAMTCVIPLGVLYVRTFFSFSLLLLISIDMHVASTRTPGSDVSCAAKHLEGKWEQREHFNAVDYTNLCPYSQANHRCPNNPDIQRYYWSSSDPFHPERFCYCLNESSILFVGDSVSSETYLELECRLKSFYQDDMRFIVEGQSNRTKGWKPRFAKAVISSRFCNVNISFIRIPTFPPNTISRVLGNLETSFPCNSVVVLNSGIWYSLKDRGRRPNFFVSDVTNTTKGILEQMLSACEKQPFTTKTKCSVSPLVIYRNNYDWKPEIKLNQTFQEMDRAITCNLAGLHGIEVIDIRPISNVSGFKGRWMKDNYHWCAPLNPALEAYLSTFQHAICKHRAC